MSLLGSLYVNRALFYIKIIISNPPKTHTLIYAPAMSASSMPLYLSRHSGHYLAFWESPILKFIPCFWANSNSPSKCSNDRNLAPITSYYITRCFH